MASKRREYRFKIEAFTPETMPMARLAEYLADLAIVLGSETSVHLVGIESSSTVPLMLVDYEAEPKVHERIRALRSQEPPADAVKAFDSIDRRLAQDNATGVILDPAGGNLIVFPGRERVDAKEFGPLSEPATVEGVPIVVGGRNDPVPVHLADAGEEHICLVKREVAKQIARHLFTSFVRIEGTARRVRRNNGVWETTRLYGSGFTVLRDANLENEVESLRAIRGQWKEQEDPLGTLEEIRRGKLQ